MVSRVKAKIPKGVQQEVTESGVLAACAERTTLGPMRAAVLGAGAWGTALAGVLCENEHQTTLWTWQQEHDRRMRASRENEFLPGLALPHSLSTTARIEEAVAEAELLVLVVPSSAVRETIRQARPFLGACRGVVCASKGIEQGTLQLMGQVIEEELGVSDGASAFALPQGVGVLSGPSFAREVARRVPTNLVGASKDPEFASVIQSTFSTTWLRVYTSSDPIGVEVGGALKNVIAVAAGACDGLGLGANTRAALITRGIAEMSRLVMRLGGSPLTLAGLSGLGDLVLTCTGELSRNRTLGFKIGAGSAVEAALGSSDGVAEGYVSAKSVHNLGAQLGVELPICDAVYSVLYAGKSAAEALADLLSRPLKAEWEAAFEAG